jgi:hypothetical protein
MDVAKLLEQLGPQLAKIESDLIAVAQAGTWLQRFGLLYDAVLQVMLLADTISGAIGADKKAFVIAAVEVLYDRIAAYIPGHMAWGIFLDAGIKTAIAAIIERIYSSLFSQANIAPKVTA